MVGSVQTGLGLTVNTNKLTVGIAPEFRRQVRDLLISAWSSSRRIFKVADTQKLIGKMAHLGEGALDLQDHVAYLHVFCLCFKAEQIAPAEMLAKIPRYSNQNREKAI